MLSAEWPIKPAKILELLHMVDKQTKFPAQTGVTVTDQRPEGRRRFVKSAAIGLPAVLTLHSGGLAALSLPCRERPENWTEVEENPNGSCALSGML